MGWPVVHAGNSPSSEVCRLCPSASWGWFGPAAVYLSKRREEIDVAYRRQYPVSSVAPLPWAEVPLPAKTKRQFLEMPSSAHELVLDFPPALVPYLITLNRWRQEREKSPGLLYLVSSFL